MKKSLLIIMSVAVLGALGLYINKGHGTTQQLGTSITSPSQMTQTSSTPANNSSSSTATTYNEGTFTGSAADTPYGTVKVAAVISGGKITNIEFLEMPNDQGHSQEVTMMSEPLLKQQAIQHQSANIDFVSGATSTSDGFEQSLQNALNQAAA